MRSRMRTILMGMLVSVVSLAVAVLAAEGLARLVAPHVFGTPPNFGVEQVRGVVMLKPNQRIHASVPRLFDVTYTIDGQRFRRTSDVSAAPRPGVLRIAAIGDSFTFGWGANDADAYPAHLESILQSTLRTNGSPVTPEVINASIPGIGLGGIALFYDRWVRDFSPRIVVLLLIDDDPDRDANTLFALNEDGSVTPRPVQQQAYHGRLSWARSLVTNSELFDLARRAFPSVVYNLQRGRAAGSGSVFGSNERQRFTQVVLPFMTAEIKWLYPRVQASGARLFVVFAPQATAVYPHLRASNAEEAWKEPAVATGLQQVCAQEGIPFLDLTPQLRDAAKTGPYLYYQRIDPHPTPAGYQAIAQGVANFLIGANALSR